MSRYAAIVRDDEGLVAVDSALRELDVEATRLAHGDAGGIDAFQVTNMVVVARLIVRSALARKESRGLHFNIDYPGRDDVHFRRDTVLTQGDLF